MEQQRQAAIKAMEKIEQILQYKWVIIWAFAVGVFCGMVITEKLTKK